MAPRKKRVDPLEEGSLKDIFKLILGPFTVFKPAEMTVSEWFEFLFHTKYRDITRYQVMRPFRMPGLYYTAPTVKVQGIGTRDVPAGAFLFVRTDTRFPDTNDVQWVGREDRQFCLNSTELGLILLNCEEAKRRRGRPKERDDVES